ncbi:hypothetical protein L9F63_001359, partial [Diploptera punctata]
EIVLSTYVDTEPCVKRTIHNPSGWIDSLFPNDGSLKYIVFRSRASAAEEEGSPHRSCIRLASRQMDVHTLPPPPRQIAGIGRQHKQAPATSDTCLTAFLFQNEWYRQLQACLQRPPSRNERAAKTKETAKISTPTSPEESPLFTRHKGEAIIKEGPKKRLQTRRITNAKTRKRSQQLQHQC